MCNNYSPNSLISRGISWHSDFEFAWYQRGEASPLGRSGMVASLERGDTGSIPAPHTGLKHPLLPQLQCTWKRWLQCDPWPWSSTPRRAAKKEKNIKRGQTGLRPHTHGPRAFYSRLISTFITRKFFVFKKPTSY